MKQVRVTIETAWVGASEEVIIEVEDDATEQDVADAAHEEFLNYCSYGYSVIGEEEDEE
ncbi:DUF7167 family protein [Pantoea ananatis]|uniref:DUF7167 family protein n=1 Tax=Pantoea ananas TaxID=553 RepID=UPI001B31827E|nr:hypothetical protein [Pantoea ananatis]